LAWEVQTEFLLLHAILLLHWALDLNQLAAYGSLFQCSEKKQVQNDAFSVVTHLTEAGIEAKNFYFIQCILHQTGFNITESVLANYYRAFSSRHN